MSCDLGDLEPLSIQIRNAAGELADAGSVSVTITLPDGTTETHGPIVSTTPGVYDFDYPTVQAGRHHARWVATGTNASAFTDSFDVSPADDGDFVSLADAKSHLKKSVVLTGDDEKLRIFLSAACQMITDRMGQVSPVTVVHVGTARRVIVLPRRPVISIILVEQLPDLEVVPAADESAGVAGWLLTSSEGVLRHTTSFCHRVRVTYRAGRNPLPANFRLAALELTAHLWRTSQLNSGGGRPAVGVDETIVPGVSYALPYNVRQLLGLDKRPNDEIFVG